MSHASCVNPMETKIISYRDLEIWKKGIKISKEVYQITENFPKQEMYGLVSQMRRSAISIPCNVAEGFRRQYNNEFKQFLYIALGSAAELETQILLSVDLNFLNKDNSYPLLEDLDHFARMTTNLLKKVEQS